jgi:conjugative transposon TraM protein
MKIDFKQPKYVLPAIALPFLILFCYVWQSGFSKKEPEAKPVAELNANVGSVSSDVRKKDLSDKLDAYRNTYKDADGLTAVNIIPKETSSNEAFRNDDLKQKQSLDSIQKAVARKFPSAALQERPGQDMAATLNSMASKHISSAKRPVRQPPDPMDVFKQQMSYIDSVGKMNDPEYRAQKRKQQSADSIAKLKSSIARLTVTKMATDDATFNTIKPETENNFISAMIDENITGYAGSRLRLKLLEDIRVGGIPVKKGTQLFAQVSGFSEQRVVLTVSSLVTNGKILPVKLEVYDLDGLPGLYVPASAFRDFTKDLGGTSVQGVTLDGTSGSQFIMSSVSKVFQSTSSAIAELLRKNKAKLKYNSYLYLIDPEQLQAGQKNQ